MFDPSNLCNRKVCSESDNSNEEHKLISNIGSNKKCSYIYLVNRDKINFPLQLNLFINIILMLTV